jgi:hypothetical protein
MEELKEYHCEDCGKFDETDVPADCAAGHGKVAFRHSACPDFILGSGPSGLNEGGLPYQECV